MLQVNGKVFRIGHLGNMDELMMCSAISGAEMAMLDAGGWRCRVVLLGLAAVPHGCKCRVPLVASAQQGLYQLAHASTTVQLESFVYIGSIPSMSAAIRRLNSPGTLYCLRRSLLYTKLSDVRVALRPSP